MPAASSLSMRIPHTGSTSIAIGCLLRSVPMSTRDTGGDVLAVRLYAPSDERRIVLHESDQRRTSRVLPGKPYEVQAGGIRDSAAMHDATIGSLDPRNIDPRRVGSIPRRPNDRVDLGLASIVEDRSTALDLRQSRPQRHAGALEATGAGSDQHVARGELPPQSRVGAYLHEPDDREPPEQILAEQALRKRRHALSDREGHVPRGREFVGDLVTGVPSSDDDDLTLWQLRRISVVGAVDLEDLVVGVVDHSRDERGLERSGRNDDLVRAERILRGLREVLAICP